VNSTDKCKPLLNKKNTAKKNVTKDTAFSTRAWRMKGMSFLILNNSMVISS
jgi:hypothetical protein